MLRADETQTHHQKNFTMIKRSIKLFILITTFFAGSDTANSQDAPVLSTEEPLRFKIESACASAVKLKTRLLKEGNVPLYYQESGSIVDNWPGDLGSHSALHCRTIQNQDQPLTITNVETMQAPVTTGKGNSDFMGLLFSITAEGVTGKPVLENMKFHLKGTTDINDVDNFRLYRLGSDLRFQRDQHQLVGEAVINENIITLKPSSAMVLSPGKQNYAVLLDVNENATEGNLIRTSILSAKAEGQEPFIAADTTAEFPATIFLTQSTLFSPGDLGSSYYRIPAIVTANDGTLVTATDRRNCHEGDLPADIDIYIRRSTDMGKTWGDPLMIAGANTTLGYGDPALVVESGTGNIFCMTAHKQGLWGSSPADPLRIVVCESSDHGQHWSDPADITDDLYGAACPHPVSKHWEALFISSGRGLQLSNGRLMFAGVVKKASGSLDNHIIYSDDKGISWDVNTNLVHQGGDEAKLAQRSNGDVVVTIRNNGLREWNVSEDNGDTWGTTVTHPDLVDPNCNGEMMTFTSKQEGYERNRLLHSLAYAPNRENVSMLLSYDEGETFPVVKTICPSGSAYSTFTILHDNTIGMYYEDRSVGGGFDMVFVRFSLKWLTGGNDFLHVIPVRS